MTVRLLGMCALLSLALAPAASHAQQLQQVPPPTCAISVAPMIIASNSFATLSWSTQNADSASIVGIGPVQPRGNMVVRATYDKDFSIFAQGKGGYCERSTSLAVRDPYASYGYFPQTVQSVVYPLFGYQTTVYSTPTYRDPYYYEYDYKYYDYDDDDDDYYDWDDYYYDKYYYPKYEEVYYKPYYNPCDWSGCWE